MNDENVKALERRFKTFILPFQIGVYLGVNAVNDAALVSDGPNCAVPKAEFIYGNHDANSTLFSPYGFHRIFYTMSHPLRQQGNPEERIEAVLSVLARSGHYGIVLVTGLPFQALAGMDYEGMTSAMKEPVPVTSIPPKSLEYDWLEGYALTLKAFAAALPAVHKKKEIRRNTVAVAGYFFDRNEGDHRGNIAEMKRLLSMCGLELVSVFPDGGSFSGLSAALDAEYVVSMPYGRSAAEIIAGNSGAELIETGLPAGFRGTLEWLEKICAAAGIKVPEAVYAEERKSREQYLRVASVLRHKPVLYAGEPHLFGALRGFLKEIGMRPDYAVFDCAPVKLQNPAEHVLFSPSTEQVWNFVSSLKGFDRPAVMIGGSFAVSEGFAKGIPYIELGFPSYSRHCFTEEPFLGFRGALNLTAMLLNSQLSV